MTTKAIPAYDAQLLWKGERRFPTRGKPCTDACAFAWCCSNFEHGENCRGFILMDGDNAKLLQRNLDSDTIEYIQNAYAVVERSIQNGDVEYAELLERDIQRLKDIAFPQQTAIPTGFRAMLENITIRQLPPAPNYIEQYNERLFPQVCSEECKFHQCPYHRPQNYGSVCKHQWLQYRVLPENFILGDE